VSRFFLWSCGSCANSSKKEGVEAGVEQTVVQGMRLMVLGERTGKLPLVLLHAPQEEAQRVYGELQTPCMLACVDGADWARDFTPWPAPGLRAGERFAGEAEAYMERLCTVLMPQLERMLPAEASGRYLCGYSLAGLFAVWSWLRGGPWDGVGCFSGSVWYDGFADWALGMMPDPAALSLSIGQREKRTREPRMVQGECCMRRLAQAWEERMPVSFALEPGGHFTDVPGRIARGIDRLLALPAIAKHAASGI